MTFRNLTWAGLVVLLALPVFLRAETPPAADTRLREALRETTLQLRSTQTDLATAQAAEAQLAQEKKELAEKYEALRKRALAEASTADKSLSDVRQQAADQKIAIKRLREALEKTRTDLEAQNEATKSSQGEAAALKERNAVLMRRVEDREQKNLALFLLGNEILARYEDFSLGRAIQSKEPFVGKARVRLENLVQDYEDQLAADRVRP